MVLLDGTTATEECNKEDDAANNNQEDWGVEELVTKEVEVLGVGALDGAADDDEQQARQLETQFDEMGVSIVLPQRGG